MNPQETELYRELVHQIALELIASFRSTGDKRGYPSVNEEEAYPSFEHFWASYIENACDVLWKLGLAEGIKYDGSPSEQGIFPYYFRMTIPAERLRDHLADQIPDNSPSLHEVIAAFVGLAQDCGRISVGREPFLVGSEHRNVVAQLAMAGFARKVDDCFEWTDKIMPIMQQIHVWTDEGESLAALRRANTDKRTENAWKTMPDLLRARLRKNQAYLEIGNVRRLMLDHWENDEWSVRPRSEEEYRYLPPEFDEIVEGLQAHFVDADED